MGFETDYNPTDYLKRRVKYYKKKKASVKRSAKDPHFIKQYGEKQLAKIVIAVDERYSARIAEYEDAIKVLTSKTP